MYRMRHFLGLIYISAGVYACSTIRSSTNSVRSFSTFPTATTQAETRLLNTDLETPQLMTIYRDSLLLVVNNLNTNPHHVRIFDIARKKAVNNILPVSQKNGGTLSFMSFGITDSLVWAFDVAKNGFIVANLETVLKGNGGLEHYSEYRIKPQVFYYDAFLLNRDEALLSGNYDTDEKLAYINFLNGTLNKQLLSYQEDSSIGSSMVNKMSYESFMLLKPDKKKMLLASRYADQVELLDLVNGKYTKINGPVGFLPQLSPYTNNSGATVATPDRETFYGFLKGHATENFFYLLFSGYYYKSEHRFFGNKIFVYNWEGNPVRQINLKNDVVDFAVTSDDKRLYTLNGETRSISFSELK